MEISNNNIIGELVAQDYRYASIFKKHNIDFCCQGNITIDEVCEKNKIDTQLLINDLESAIKQENSNVTDYKSWPLDLLADYVEKKHHRYVETAVLEIKPYLEKICKVHGGHHPELHEINDLFIACSGELIKHMKKEELILFPYIRNIANAKQKNTPAKTPNFGSVQNPINMMMDEHTAEGERFRRIAELSDNYTPPQEACNTYKVTFALLKEFEDDLHLHIHLENNILFPNAIKLESELSYA